MLEDPGLDFGRLSRTLQLAYGTDVTAVRFIPGYDPQAASYELTAGDATYFLKAKHGAVNETALLVPRALLDAGIENVLAPIRTRTSELWADMDGVALVLYPFVRGQSAMDVGLTDDGWRTFGSALSAVHGGGLEHRFADRLPTESFARPSAELVRRMLAVAAERHFESRAASRLAEFLRDSATRVNGILERAESLGADLRSRRFVHVLCHADIHAANILVADDGRIFLVDWDGPLIAPRERDLLFVIGSRVARVVEPAEEALFFEGYGDVDVDSDAIVYYRYERVIEDIGEFAKSVFENTTASEATRETEAELAIGNFGPGGMLETAEVVAR